MNFLAQMLGGGTHKHSNDATAATSTPSGNVSGGQIRYASQSLVLFCLVGRSCPAAAQVLHDLVFTTFSPLLQARPEGELRVFPHARQTSKHGGLLSCSGVSLQDRVLHMRLLA